MSETMTTSRPATADVAERGNASKVIDRIGATILAIIAVCTVLLLSVPSLIVIAISFTETAYIGFPPQGFTFQWYADLFARDQIIDAAVTSLQISAATTCLSLALAIPAAYGLVRGRFFGRGFASALIVAPQMLPGMVIGVATLFFGAYIAFRQSNLMVILALTVFCLPFAVRMVMARLTQLDPALEEASLSMGASKTRTFFEITARQLVGAIIAGGAFVAIEAFDNLTVALFTASPRSRPLSVELYNLVQFDSSPMVAALSSLEILAAFVVMIVLAKAVGLDRLRT
ncbi:ABC transporter permease [Jiella marina]|uniref:ABC transporter permease n=1 Tax=Jiella sp. LLJ827 TaxID=2917712 RepID=UPI00210082DC|nr:ABC transporter permease [Jiella sp. LLJ827]MCQ0986313.1 ABC transporter permease [Jiella sp. LLJ827]